MTSHLLYPSIRTYRNRLYKNGRLNYKLLLLALLGLAICLVLYIISWKTISYFHAQNELGIILSMKIFQMIWITIFAMLIFSSMITGVSTLYLSRDNEIIVASPVTMSQLYQMRLMTTFINSSWMALIFTLPVFTAFGIVLKAGFWYWPLLIVTLPATAATATASALLVIIVLVYLFPARRTRDIIFYLTLCFGIFLYLVFRLMRPEDMVNPEKYGQFIEYLSAVSNPAGPWLPAGWSANLLTTSLLDRRVDWLLLILVILTPLVLYYIGEMVMSALFLHGYSKSQESFGGHRRFVSFINSGSAWVWIVKKELIAFLRDSKEWSQFFMIAALVVVYLYNFKVLPLERTFGTVYIANLIAFGNIGLTGFLSASLATRFVYPAVGAEGGAFYLIRSSPLTLSRFIFYKYIFYMIPFTILTLVLIGVSNHFLQISGPMWWISLFCAIITCWTVIAMALGFGSLFADFNAENRAASMGIGAVFYLFCSLSYVLVVLLLGFRPTYRLMRNWISHQGIPLMDALLLALWGAGTIVLSIIIGTLICRKGIAALQTR